MACFDAAILSTLSLMRPASTKFSFASVSISKWRHSSECRLSLANFCASRSASSACCMKGATAPKAIDCAKPRSFCRAASNSRSAASNTAGSKAPFCAFSSCSRINSCSTSSCSSAMPGLCCQSSGIMQPRFINTFAALVCRDASANINGVLLEASISSKRARLSAKRSKTSAPPAAAAACTGVCFTTSTVSMSAYRSSNRSTTAVWPRAAAHARAVRCSSVLASGSA
mmetsp:Transcript_101906/g.285643  ORF Transcript_101906/g.285643 Transcript_101906/m.285643 type:complete len:228 (-) Transcript_101906:396-1079(-)